MHDPEVGDQLDGYRLTELLARGGMASVFKAVDVDSGQEVVLKIPYIQYESDVVFYQRFEREEKIGQGIITRVSSGCWHLAREAGYTW